MGESIKHANPETYAEDLKEALNNFEEALLWRYKADLGDQNQVWTTHGEEPPKAPVSQGPESVWWTLRNETPGWAADARQWVSMAIVEYGTQDLNKLESAVDDLHSAERFLGGTDKVGDDGSLSKLTNDINDKCDFATWAGASGEEFKDNFGKSVDPTMENQRKIATNLIFFYCARACIIESVRRNTLNAFKRAAQRLRETEDSDQETATWTFISVVGIAVGLGIPPLAGAGLSAATLVGSLLDGKDPDQEFAHDIKGVVKQLVDDLGKAGSDAGKEEGELFDKIIELQKDIAGVKSKELELYDFTGGGYSATAPAGGFDVSVDDVYNLAKLCFEASQEYEKVITKVVSTDDADGELKGENHVETAADAELIDTKDTLVSFLKTTCARYYEAGERLHDTALAYFGVETDNKKMLKALEGDPDLNGSDRDGDGGSVDKHIKGSNRDDIEDLTDHEDPPEQSAPGGVDYGAG